MIVEQLHESTISKLPPFALWSMSDTAACDMCVADPSVEQTSSSMESCTRENNDNTVTVDLDPPISNQDGTSSGINIIEVYSLDEESPVKKSETDESCVMISDDETENIRETHDKGQKREKGDGDVQVTGSSSGTSGAAAPVSAEMISEIDKEILKSLQGKFMNLKNLLGEIKNEGAKPKLETRKRPVKETQKEQSTTAAGPKPKIHNKEYKREDSDIQLKSKTEKTSNTAKMKWEVEQYRKPLVEDMNNIPVQKNDVKTEAVTVDEDSGEHQPKDDRQEDDVVWICFICAKGFPNQQELMSHQDICEDDMPACDNVLVVSVDQKPAEYTSVDEPDTHLDSPHDSSHVPETDRISVNKTLVNTDLPTAPMSRPVPAHLTKVGTGIKSLPLGLPKRIPRRRKIKEIYIPPPRDKYFECLGLGETPTVEEIFKSPRKSVSEDDCQFIDLTVDEIKSQLSSPMTPRTRSLMSQLSRDENGRRRQLSFSSSPNKPEIKTEVNQRENKAKQTDSDSESSETSEEETAKCKSVPFKSALLGIPLSSPLGQRLKKHWQNEIKVPVISNIEMFCKSAEYMSELDQEAVDKKSPMMEKLRNRPPPQITFRFTKKYLNKWFHLYKFNKADKLEFEKTIRTGLECESRRRAKLLKPCKVVLNRLKKKEIKYWTTPRVNQRTFMGLQAMGPSRTAVRARSPSFNNVRPMVRHTQSTRQPTILLNQPHRTRFHSPMLRHRLVNQAYRFNHRSPTPQLLVRPHSGAGNRMMLEVRNAYPVMYNLLGKQGSQSLLGRQVSQSGQSGPSQVDRRSQKRKQTFDQLRTDDNLVICLSSDEEEEEPNKGSEKCSKCILFKGICSEHKRKIGPASLTRNRLKKAKVIESSPVKTGGTREMDSASSRVFGKSQLTNTFKVVPNQAGLGVSNYEIVNGKVFVQQYAQNPTSQESQEATVDHTCSQNGDITRTELAVPGTVTSDAAEPGESSRSQSDSEYMDYEVICIDSDDDGD